MKKNRRLMKYLAAFVVSASIVNPMTAVKADGTGGSGTDADPYTGVCTATAPTEGNVFTITCSKADDPAGSKITITSGSRTEFFLSGNPDTYGFIVAPTDSSDENNTILAVTADAMKYADASYIPAGTYATVLKINSKYYSLGNMTFYDIYKPYPNDFGFSAESENSLTNVVISGSDEFKQAVYQHMKGSVGSTAEDDLNNGTQINIEKVGGGFYTLPMSGNAGNGLSYSNGKLMIPASTFSALGMQTGTYKFRMSSYTAGYGGSIESGEISITTDTKAYPDDIEIFQEDPANSKYALIIKSVNKDYLQKLSGNFIYANGYGMTFSLSNTTYTSLTDPAVAGGKYTLKISSKLMQGMYEGTVGDSTATIKLHSTGYLTYEKDISWVCPISDPGDFSIKVVGTGAWVYTSNQAFADAFIKRSAGEIFVGSSSFGMNKQLAMATTFFSNYNAQDMNLSIFSYVQENGQYKLIIPFTMQQLETQTNNSFDFSSDYYTYLNHPLFTTKFSNTKVSFAPVKLYAEVQNASKTSGNLSSANLATLDDLAVNALSENVTVSATETKPSGTTTGSTVSVTGEVAGSITTDNTGAVSSSDVDTVAEDKTITVTTDITDSASGTAEEMIESADLEGAEAVGDAFDVTITKTNTDSSTTAITEIPYAAAISCTVPEGTDVAADEELAMVTEHTVGDQTTTSVIPVTVETVDGTTVATGYTSKFSSFTLVKAKKKQVQQAVEKQNSSQWCVTFLDCKGNTVSVQWITTGQDAEAPAGYQYSGYTNVSSHRDIWPNSCSYTAPNTASR